ncbi:DUF4430 domain-containing protein [Dolosicoccus paucivorans]|uniref:DUF4430 domain-containing protein n=1 Tax=Dolosicoccus paucivorans TaxID=84521 RepID=A0A1G8J299_9LACT|nr:DUF4430 domain-containing protein [Dolosicoccus paucivorans]PMB84419.1 DUF4430 domain-containing protein [Dolosicoccus paucivorans]PMC59052.1 DUF4430 domain-containing protein [Dolosicoccus paucivorans]SDI25316.1 protein of unknown function [Dolosicoccus paucivorans]
MFKKLSLLMASVFLVGCATTNAPSTTQSHEETSIEKAQTIDVIIQLKIKDAPDQQKEVRVEEGATALDALKKAYEVKESDGFVTEIDGYSNDETTQTYWMYEVNGTMAEVGANDYLLNNHDTMTWTLEPIQ